MINVAVFESNYLLSGQIDEWFQIIGNKYYIHFVTDFYFTKSLIEKAMISAPAKSNSTDNMNWSQIYLLNKLFI